ncbi:MAG: shikimate dehydrogenase [Wolinella sp.]
MHQYAVFGNPITHSKSPLLHNYLFLSLAIPAFYGRYHLFKESELVESFKRLNLAGANVTIPFKEVAFLQCDEVRGIARQIGSVNTLVREGNRIIGYNTDAEGFMQTLEGKIQPKSVLLLGAGGTARAIASILASYQIPLLVLNRSAKRLESFTLKGYESATHEDFTRFLHPRERAFDLIINTTSAGLSDDLLPLDSALLTPLLHAGVLAYDVIYGRETPFLAHARANGARTLDGREMLIEQAALSSFYFNDRVHDLGRIRELMHRALP